MARPCDDCGHVNVKKRKKPHECDTCNTCDQHCERDARWTCGYNATEEGNGGPPCRPLPECFRCGEKVCRNCSSKRKYLRYGKVRLCNGCQIEEDGHSRRVLYRIARKAGYSRAGSKAIVKEREPQWNK